MHWLLLVCTATLIWPWEPSAPCISPAEPSGEFQMLFQITQQYSANEVSLPTIESDFAWMSAGKLFDRDRSDSHVNHFPTAIYDLDGDYVPAELSWEAPSSAHGMFRDPDRWRFRGDMSAALYRRTVKVEVPNPTDVRLPYTGRDWKHEDRFQIPMPIPLPIAEQMFVYGQFGGNGDALNNRQTTLTGKTGVGMRFSPVGNTELQLRYGTWLNYADVFGITRFQERPQPAIELIARLPIIGEWQLEYTGSALPALQTSSHDQLRQELRLAVPLGSGDNEFEFGARYRWDVVQTPTPWVDRAQLFMGLKFRR